MLEAPPSEPNLAPRSAIITLYGSFVVPFDNWIAVADIVELLGELEIEGPSVRAAVARLKTSGLLESAQRNGVAGYAASKELLEVLHAGDARIFTSQVPADLDDGWMLAVFSVPESQRDKRHRLRSQLSSLGFGAIASGVWMAPARTHEDAVRQLERSGLAQYVHLFEGRYLGFESLRGLTQETWDSTELADSYGRFIELNRDSINKWEASGQAPGSAFRSCMLALEAWRPLTFRDPGLPDAIEPCSQIRSEARKLFAEIGARLKDSADAHVFAATGSS